MNPCLPPGRLYEDSRNKHRNFYNYESLSAYLRAFGRLPGRLYEDFKQMKQIETSKIIGFQMPAVIRAFMIVEREF